MLRSQKKNWESQAGSIELSKKHYSMAAARRWRRSQHNDGYDGKGSTLLGKATHWRGPSAALSTVLLCSAIAECVSVCKKWTNSSWLSLPLLQPPTPSDGYSHCIISILDTSFKRWIRFSTFGPLSFSKVGRIKKTSYFSLLSYQSTSKSCIFSTANWHVSWSHF